jgi:hypothetical protein
MEFVDIEGYEGLYKINILGDVWTCRNNRVLKPTIVLGYKRVTLSKDGKRKSYKIHRLIMLHFVPNPNNLKCVDHINRIKHDNRIENLRWVSHRDNSINSNRIENRKGYIQTKPYKRKDGTITTTYRLQYILTGEYGKQNIKSKTFKTLEEAESFRNQIYG